MDRVDKVGLSIVAGIVAISFVLLIFATGDLKPSTGSAMMLLAALLIAAYGLALMFGKGVTALAGINSMTEEERSELDLKKIGRASGYMLMGFAALFAIGAYYVACGLDGSGTLIASLGVVEMIGFALYIGFSSDFRSEKGPAEKAKSD